MYWLCQDSCVAILSAYYAFAEYFWWWGALICNVETRMCVSVMYCQPIVHLLNTSGGGEH